MVASRFTLLDYVLCAADSSLKILPTPYLLFKRSSDGMLLVLVLYCIRMRGSDRVQILFDYFFSVRSDLAIADS